MNRLALMLPFWLACVVGETSVLHTCPMHGSAPAREQAAPSHHHHDAPSAPGEHTGCNCIGACNSTTSAALPGVLSTGAGTVPLTESPARARGVNGFASDSQLRLPFSNGPPARNAAPRA